MAARTNDRAKSELRGLYIEVAVARWVFTIAVAHTRSKEVQEEVQMKRVMWLFAVEAQERVKKSPQKSKPVVADGIRNLLTLFSGSGASSYLIS